MQNENQINVRIDMNYLRIYSKYKFFSKTKTFKINETKVKRHIINKQITH